MFFKKKPSSFLFREKDEAANTQDQDSEVPDQASEHGSSETSFLGEAEIRSLRRSRRPLRWWLIFILAHLVLAAAYTWKIVTLTAEVHKLRRSGPGLAITPANEAVEYELHSFTMNDMNKGPFSGLPRDEVNQNWHNLLNAENIIIPREYMELYGRTEFGVAVPGTEDFIGTLNVYHELHCIKRIYQYTYPEYYNKDQTPAQAQANRMHKDHCLDFLRQSAMCHADVGVMTFQWSEASQVPIANSTAHQCRNWDKIDAWTKARTVDMMKPGWLVHPSRGPAYGPSKG